MKIFIHAILIFTVFLPLSGFANSDVDQHLAARKLLFEKFNKLSTQEKGQRGQDIAAQANQLFFKAQEARIKEEITKLIADEKSWKHRGWEKESAKKTRLAKEEALKVIRSLQAAPPKRAISCLSEITSTDTSSKDVLSFISKGNTSYSKSSSGSGSLFDSAEDKAWARLTSKNSSPFRGKLTAEEQAELILENTIPSHLLRQRVSENSPAIVKTSIKLSATEIEGLKVFGVTAKDQVSSSSDYSHRFSAPKLQPPKTAMCAGYAISSDMESILNGIIQTAKVSADYTYTILSQSQPDSEVKRAGLCNLIGVRADPLAGVASMANALETLTKSPTCSTNEESDHRLTKTQYNISSFKSLKVDNPSFDFFRELLSAGVTPMVVISSEKRKERENWLYLERGGEYKHIVNVVGYGKEREPNCLDNVDYLIVRDSLGKTPIHYRVSAEAFSVMAQEIHKVTGVKEDLLTRFNPLK
jgi:hypothetical protein